MASKYGILYYGGSFKILKKSIYQKLYAFLLYSYGSTIKVIYETKSPFRMDRGYEL